MLGMLVTVMVKTEVKIIEKVMKRITITFN